MAGASVVCGDCNRWLNTAGTPICGLCRISRAIQLLPTDPRVTASNYDLVNSILERSLGEVNSWLSIPLDLPASSAECEEKSLNPGKEYLGAKASSSEDKESKGKRSSKNLRREARREERRLPPTPPDPPRRAHSPEPAAVLAASSKRKASPGLLRPDPSLDPEFGWPRKIGKKNKGKKHRERGIAYRKNLVRTNLEEGCSSDGASDSAACRRSRPS